MKNLNDLHRDFQRAANAYKEMYKKLPANIGKVAVKTIHENFDRQGWCENDGAVQRWKPRSPVTNEMYDKNRTLGKNKKTEKNYHKKFTNSYKGSVYSSANPILKQTGNLYDSISYDSSTNRVNIGVNQNNMPYAKINNEGGTANFNGKIIRIPKRKFLGFSQKLNFRIKLKTSEVVQKGFKQFKMAR